MRIVVDKRQFSEALDKIKGIPVQKTLSMILGHMLLESVDEGLRITALNYEVGMQLITAAKIEDGGRIAVPAKKLIDAVTRAPEGEIILSTEDDENWLRLQRGSYHLRLPLMDPDNMPSVQKVEEKLMLKIPEGTLLEIIEKCSFAISNDESRPNLNGLFMKILQQDDGYAVEAVATDGKRLSIVRRRISEYKEPPEEIPLLIHKRGIVELKRFLKGDLDNVTLIADKKGVKIIRPEGFIVVRQIEIGFPKYELVIPNDYNISFEVSPQQLIETLKRVGISADEAHTVKFHLKPGKLIIKAEDKEGSIAQDELDINYDGEETSFRYDYVYLLDALGVFSKTRAVEFRIVDNYHASMIVEAGGKEDVLELVMPIKPES